MSNLPVNIRRALIAVGIIILVVMVIDFNRRVDNLNNLSKQDRAMQSQATQAMQTQQSLQTQVAYAGSTQAVGDWARTEGHYIQPGDQPVVPIGQPGIAPIDSSTPTPEPTPMSNWQTWWNLFFGE